MCMWTHVDSIATYITNRAPLIYLLLFLFTLSKIPGSDLFT